MHYKALFADQRVGFWGIGNENKAALRLYRRYVPTRQVTVFSDREIDSSQQQLLQNEYGALRFVTGTKISPDSLAQCDMLVRSPGISIYRPEIAELRQRKPSTQFTSATALGLLAPERAKKCIAVTGTKGKSTTTSLIYHCMKQLGFSVDAGGNLGTALPDLDFDADWWVVELSSYQIPDLPVRPKIAVLTNLFPAHTGWHGGLEQYYKDKLSIFEPTADSIELISAEDPVSVEMFRGTNTARWYMQESGMHLRKDDIFFGREHLGNGQEMTLQGRHNLANVCAALAACQAIGIAPTDAFQAACRFTALPWRQQYLGQHRGHHYVDDSIATVPEATIAALTECSRKWPDAPITLLLGGQRVERDNSGLLKQLCTTADLSVVLIPDSGEDFHRQLNTFKSKQRPSVENTASLAEGVIRAQKITPQGGIILLSPAAPSFEHFRNYKHRSAVFREAAGLPEEQELSG